MILAHANSTHAFRRVQCLGIILAALNAMPPQITIADEPVKPVRWIRDGELETIAWLPYETPRKERRALRVVREQLNWDRDMTDRDMAAWTAVFVESKDPRDRNLARPYNTFQHRSQALVFWIMDGPPSSKLEEGRPLGVVYAEPGPCGPILKNFAADLLWHASREQFLLILSMSCNTDLTIAIFPLDLKAKLQVKPFGIAGKPRAEWPRPESSWPKPLAPIADVLPDSFLDSAPKARFRTFRPFDSRPVGAFGIFCR